MIATPIQRDDWLRMPTGKVCVVRSPGRGPNPDVTLRYVDEHGAMSTTDFHMTLRFIRAHCERVAAHA